MSSLIFIQGVPMRDHSMFDFLVGDASAKTVDLELAKEFAKQAASAFLGTSPTSLNDTITKIASVEQLNPDQVQIVCHEANKLVNTELFKTAENKYTDFELADAAIIIGSLEGSEKTASVQHFDNDYDLAPDEQKSFADFSLTKTASGGHAGLADDSKRVSRGKLEKLAFKKQRLEDDIILYNSEVQGLENRFVKIARTQLIPYGLKERRGAFPYITQFCKQAGLSAGRTQELMGLLNTVMERQGLVEKTADMKADANLISDKLNARVVNGTHPLYIVVKTIKDKDDEKKLYQERGNIIKEQMDTYKADGALLGTKEVKAL